MNTLVKSCLQNGFLMEPELADILLNVPSFDEEINSYLAEVLCSINKNKMLSISALSINIDKILLIFDNYKSQKKEKSEIIDRYASFLKSHLKPLVPQQAQTEKKEEKAEEISKSFNGHVKIIDSFILPSRKISVGDFLNHFRNPFIFFKSILQERNELQNLTSINKINGQKQNVSIIGIITDKRMTKNKNILLEVEDLTGRAVLLINANKEDVFKKAQSTVLDDTLGFRCSGTGEMLFVNDIVFPDAMQPERKKAPIEEYAAFTSDLHVGSIKFLEENFLKFVKWLNAEIGSEQQKEMAGKVKYLFIVGDCVDGVGVYPNQENLLAIKDIREQYVRLAELLGKIRKDVYIIMCPGQHDSVRTAEPQPPIDRYFAEPLYNLENLLLVSNPSLVNIASSQDFDGLKILMYHGASFHSLISDIEELRLANAHHSPSKVVKHILKRRHLAPTHSSVVYIPSENTDPLAITTVPDIITNGEVHRTDVSSYNNILIVSCSCWQSITPYEEKVGNEPDPCKVPLLNLKTGAVNILDFSS